MMMPFQWHFGISTKHTNNIQCDKFKIVCKSKINYYLLVLACNLNVSSITNCVLGGKISLSLYLSIDHLTASKPLTKWKVLIRFPQFCYASFFFSLLFFYQNIKKQLIHLIDNVQFKQICRNTNCMVARKTVNFMCTYFRKFLVMIILILPSIFHTKQTNTQKLLIK